MRLTVSVTPKDIVSPAFKPVPKGWHRENLFSSIRVAHGQDGVVFTANSCLANPVKDIGMSFFYYIKVNSLLLSSHLNTYGIPPPLSLT